MFVLHSCFRSNKDPYFGDSGGYGSLYLDLVTFLLKFSSLRCAYLKSGYPTPYQQPYLYSSKEDKVLPPLIIVISRFLTKFYYDSWGGFVYGQLIYSKPTKTATRKDRIFLIASLASGLATVASQRVPPSEVSLTYSTIPLF